MIAVADTSPISALLRIGRLTLLTALFESVLIPREVVAELDEGKHILGDWRTCAGAAGLSTREIRDRRLFLQLSGALHRGEAAAVVLASETPNAVLVIDESDGRAAGRRLALRVTGSLGVVVEAKRRGLVPEAAPVIQELRTTGALWLSENIVQHTLALAGER
jgi:uncharacterized protein